MIKFVIGLIALIFVALAVYTYNDKKVEVVAKSAVTHKIEKTEVREIKVEKPVSMKKEVTPPIQQKEVREKRIVQSTSTNSEETAVPENEIGKGLTLEGIENADVSDEERERMRDDMAYYQTMHTEPSEPLSHEKILQMMEEDFKAGRI